jgi:hypothetical protein
MCRMSPQRVRSASFVLPLVMCGGIAALSRMAGFSAPVVALVGAATATVTWWASATEP